MAAKEWTKSAYPGIRYRVHPERRYGNGPDKYLQLIYKWQGKTIAESIGWISKTRINEKEASFILADLQKAQRTGDGPRTLKEKRELEEQARQDEIKRREQEIKAQELQAQKDRLQTITFGQVWALYSEEASKEKKQKTWEREAQIWAKWIEPELVRVPLVKITPFLLAKLQKKIIDAGKSPRTAFYCLQTTRQVFNWAKAQDPQLFKGDNPVTFTKKVKVNNKRMRFLSHEEASSLLEALQTNDPKKVKSTHDMTLLSLHCGLRFGEVATLRWRDVSLPEGSIYIRPSVEKGGKGRTVYMTSQVKSMFQGRPTGEPDDLIFPSKHGGIRAEVSNFFQKTVDKIGLNKGKVSRLEKVTFHTMRHTCASWLVMAGVGLYQVQQLLGHSSHTMTERYSHLSPDGIKQVASAMESAVNGAQDQQEEKSKILPLTTK